MLMFSFRGIGAPKWKQFRGTDENLEAQLFL